jgi:hypothetical protein
LIGLQPLIGRTGKKQFALGDCLTMKYKHEALVPPIDFNECSAGSIMSARNATYRRFPGVIDGFIFFRHTLVSRIPAATMFNGIRDKLFRPIL